MTEWFEEWFGEEYLHLYPHRDDEDADRLVALVADSVPLAPDWRVLDVACGAGRHARAFERRGLRTVGLDLSMHLLIRAREVARVPLVRADMRQLPIRPRSMDLTVNLFTSFGYFDTDLDHLRSLREMLTTVRPGGWFVIDFLGAASVRKTLVPTETLTVGDQEIRVERWLDDGDRFVHKTITVPDGRQFMERVRLYDRSELSAMITSAGGRVRIAYGSYDGAPPDGDAPRTILMAQTT
jgi:SAM-dependent methyltransferase